MDSRLAYLLSAAVDITFLLPFAAGNFIYIAASDLVPEVKLEKDLGKNLVHFTPLSQELASFCLLVFSLEHSLHGCLPLQ